MPPGILNPFWSQGLIKSVSVALSTQARAAVIGSSLTSSIIPAVWAFPGVTVFPSKRYVEAAIAPSFLTNRVVPPAPGKRPTRISGNPIFAFELFAENIL